MTCFLRIMKASKNSLILPKCCVSTPTESVRKQTLSEIFGRNSNGHYIKPFSGTNISTQPTMYYFCCVARNSWIARTATPGLG